MNVKNRFKKTIIFGLTLLLAICLWFASYSFVTHVVFGDPNHYWIDEATEGWDVQVGIFHFPVSYASNGSWEVINGRRLTKISGSCWKQKINNIKYIVVKQNNCVFEITSHTNYIAFADGSYTGQ